MPERPTFWMIVGQGPTALAVGASVIIYIFIIFFTFFFSPLSFFSSFSLSLSL